LVSGRLRVSPPLLEQKALAIAKGLTPLVGVNGSALDLELTFDWSHTKTGAIPTAAGYEVGVSVLVGQYEHTLVTCSTGGTRFNNGTRKVGPAVALVRKAASVFEFSLCLSRACLGKMFVFIYKWRKNAVFRRGSTRGTAAPVGRNTLLLSLFLSAVFCQFPSCIWMRR
jgi:hypothetical protein